MSEHGLDRLATCIGQHCSSEIDVDEQLDLVAELLAASPLAPGRDSDGIDHRGLS